VFRTDDMLAILFPHMFEDLEYLVPEEVAMGDVEEPTGAAAGQAANAEAGPSRL
jgi:E3 ubiquitin-protein ligase SHPRH